MCEICPSAHKTLGDMRGKSMDKSLNQETYNKLKRDILTFALKPGEYVSAAKLADRYQVSRTPAREALVKLETEGMVDIYPQSRTVISKINVHRVRDEWFVRKMLEIAMVDPFFEKMTDRDLELMRAYNNELSRLTEQKKETGDGYDYLGYDNDFHGVSYMVANQRLSATIIYSMTAHYNRLRMLIDRDEVSKKRILAEHEALMECAIKRDKNGYRKILSDHLTHIVGDIETVREQYPDYFEG